MSNNEIRTYNWSCELVTSNVRGLQAKNDRLAKLKFFREQGFSILFLQETHIDDFLAMRIAKECNFYEFYHSLGTNIARGTSIAIKKDEDFEIHDELNQTDKDGRICAVAAQVHKRRINLISIYAPNMANTKKSQDNDCFFMRCSDSRMI